MRQTDVELFPENRAQMTVMLFLEVLPQTDWYETGHDCSITEIYLVYLFKMCTVFKQTKKYRQTESAFLTLKHTERFFPLFVFNTIGLLRVLTSQVFCFSVIYSVFFFSFFKDCSCWLIEVQYVLYAGSS